MKIIGKMVGRLISLVVLISVLLNLFWLLSLDKGFQKGTFRMRMFYEGVNGVIILVCKLVLI